MGSVLILKGGPALRELEPPVAVRLAHIMLAAREGNFLTERDCRRSVKHLQCLSSTDVETGPYDVIVGLQEISSVVQEVGVGLLDFKVASIVVVWHACGWF